MAINKYYNTLLNSEITKIIFTNLEIVYIDCFGLVKIYWKNKLVKSFIF